MLIALAVVGFLVFDLVVLVLVLRNVAAHRPLPPRDTEPFDGTQYRLGQSFIYERKHEAPRATVVCMHGYLESPAYFTQHYADPTLQLILIGSADYGEPFTAGRQLDAPWKAPTEPLGTIEHDAEALLAALEHLPVTKRIRVHGHSRGGAVTLEAARRRPDLFEQVEVVLEAAVLPQGKLYSPLNAVLLWLMPVVLLVLRRDPLSSQAVKAYGRLDDARKRSLLAKLPFNPNRGSTATENVRSIIRWSAATDPAVLNLVHGVALVADADRVLDSASMRLSASKGRHLKVVEAAQCSHFVIFDRPELIPPLT